MSAEREDARTVNDLLLDPRMRSRLARTLRRAFHTGIALYLLSSLLLVTMAWCLREAITQVWRNRPDIGHEIDKHLRSHPDVGRYRRSS